MLKDLTFGTLLVVGVVALAVGLLVWMISTLVDGVDGFGDAWAFIGLSGVVLIAVTEWFERRER